MAEAIAQGGKEPQLNKEQIIQLLKQFVDAKKVNTQIDGMFAPVTARLKKEAAAKDFSLLSLLFKKEDTTEIKKQLKDSFTKLFKDIKTEKLIGAKITVKPTIKVNVKPVEVAPTVKKPKSAAEPAQPKEVFGSVKKNTNVVEIAGLEQLISKVEQQSEQQQTAFESVVKTLTETEKAKKPEVDVSKKGESTKDVIKSKNAINVNLVGVDDHALKQLGKIFHTKEEEKPTATKKIEATGGWLEKLLGAIMAGFSAAKLLAAAFSDTGPLRGALKLIGDILLKVSTMMFKGVINGVTRFIKLLPESILSKFGSAKEGLAKIGSTLAKSVGNLGARVGGYIAKMGSFLIEGLAKISPTLAKGVSFIGGGLAKLAKGFGSFLMKRIKILPFIGPFIGFGFAVKRMMEGDYVGGLAEMLGNLLAIVAEPIPPLSFAISILTDLLLATYDIKTGGIKNSKNSSWNKWLGEFGRALLDTGPIRWLRNIGEALGDLLSGNWREGLAGLANTVTDLPGVGYIFDLLGAEKNSEGKRFTPKDFNIIGQIKDEIYKKIMSVFNWAKEKLNAVRKFFGLGESKSPEQLIQMRNEEADKVYKARKQLEDNAVKAHEAQQKPVVFEATREKRLNEITAERTKLEAQVEAAAKKSRLSKQPAKPIEKPAKPATIETEQAVAEAALQEPEVTVQPVSSENKTEEVRRVEIEKAQENNKDVVAAIDRLQKTQEKQVLRTPSVEKKEAPPSVVVSAVSQNVRSTNDINVDTARDNVHIARNNIRNYLSLQRAMI